MAAAALTSFLTRLQNIRGAGRFCAHGSIPFVPPGIVLKNGEDLALPLTASQAADLRGLAEPAPYGMGTETRLDESVRKCWQIDAADLRWTSARWQKALDAVVKEIADELGVAGKVGAEPYKLLLYDKGGFFLRHRDTEKTPGMFGSLIMCLPSRHAGGGLVLRHQGREERVDFDSAYDPGEIRWAAFFADCEHEVLPVTSGHRLCLAFNLVLAKGKGHAPVAPASEDEVLLPGLRHIAETRGNDLTAILLEHRYTEEGLSVAALKGDDRARAAALFAAAEKAGLTARLALVSLYQMGQLEEDYEDDCYYSRKRRRGGGMEKGQETNGEMGEVFEESLTVEHWRTPEDKKERLGSLAIPEANVLSLAALGEGKPDEKYAEGYTGNAGCTMEHWYRRAAIVVWPQDAGHVLLARYDFDAACESFVTFAATGRKKTSAMASGLALIKEAALRLAKAGQWEVDHVAEKMSPLLRGIGLLGDEALFQNAARKEFLHVFVHSDGEAWSALLRGFGARPLEFFLKHTAAGPISAHRQSWFNALDATLEDAADLLPLFAGLLPRLAAGQVPPPRHYDPEQSSSKQQAFHAHLVLAASCVLAGHPDDRQQVEAWLWGSGTLPHLREVFAPALLEKKHRAWFKKEHSLAPALRTAAIGALAAETARPLLPYPDWRRPLPPTPSSTHELIRDLLRFLSDPAAERHEIRRVQVDRLQVENYVKHQKLDLDLTTVRKGTPHTLLCRKNDNSYLRSLKQRAADEALLEKLGKIKI